MNERSIISTNIIQGRGRWGRGDSCTDTARRMTGKGNGGGGNGHIDKSEKL